MVIAKTYPPGAAPRKTPTFETVRRVVVAVQLLLLVLLLIGRAFGAVSDAHLSHIGSLSVAPSPLLSSAT